MNSPSWGITSDDKGENRRRASTHIITDILQVLVVAESARRLAFFGPFEVGQIMPYAPERLHGDVLPIA